MATSSDRTGGAREQLLQAAGSLLREAGYGALSTRRVAEAAGVPLSQIHYHFGSMQGLVLDLLKRENERLLDRQTALYHSNRPLSEKWELACRYLEEDLQSGYVRVLHEMMFAALSDPEIAQQVRHQLEGWKQVLTEVARQALEELGPIGPFTAVELAHLVAQAFLGVELLVLLDAVDARQDGIGAIRKIGALIADAERRSANG